MSTLLYLLAVLTVIFKVLCQEISLTFVIDNTNSMNDDIEQVKSLVDSTMDIVLEEKSSLISKIVLVSFNDPENATVRISTSNREKVSSALATLPVGGGIDCSELALSGIKLALDSSPPGSYIYVFTDASAKDYYMSEEILQLCQRKQSQIVFIIALTGVCGYPNSQQFQVYYNITAASSGMAIRVPSQGIENVVNKFVKEDIKGNKIGLAAELTPPNVRTKVSFSIDDLTTHAIVSASGTDVQLSHFNGPSLKTETIIWENHGKVVKLLDTKPGQYTVSVKSSSVTSIVVTGRSDFNFRYGFSKRKPKSLNDTVPQPISDIKTRLSLLVTDPKYTVRTQIAEILDMDEKVIMKLPLEELSLNFYTTTPFLPPSDIFKVAMIGVVIETGRLVRRIAKIPVITQEPQPEAPVVTGVESQEVRLGAMASIKCNVVKGVPTPELSWQFKPTNGSDFTNISNTGNEWRTSNVTTEHSGYYKCTATNSQGTDEHIVQLIVKGPARDISEGTELRIPCDTFSYPKPAVTWTVNGSPVVPGEKYSIEDGELIIKNPSKSDNDNNYTCTATKTFRTYIDDISTGVFRNVYILQGHALKLTCSLPRIGSSSIQWYIDDEDNGLYERDIIVENAQAADDGDYTCQVNDVNGVAVETFLVDVGYPPEFMLPQQNDSIYWYEGTRSLLRCDAVAKPSADVVWIVNGEMVDEKSMQLSISEYGDYKCKVSNIHGAVQRDFEVEPSFSNTDFFSGNRCFNACAYISVLFTKIIII